MRGVPWTLAAVLMGAVSAADAEALPAALYARGDFRALAEALAARPDDDPDAARWRVLHARQFRHVEEARRWLPRARFGRPGEAAVIEAELAVRSGDWRPAARLWPLLERGVLDEDLRRRVRALQTRRAGPGWACVYEARADGASAMAPAPWPELPAIAQRLAATWRLAALLFPAAATAANAFGSFAPAAPIAAVRAAPGPQAAVFAGGPALAAFARTAGLATALPAGLRGLTCERLGAALLVRGRHPDETLAAAAHEAWHLWRDRHLARVPRAFDEGVAEWFEHLPRAAWAAAARGDGARAARTRDVRFAARCRRARAGSWRAGTLRALLAAPPAAFAEPRTRAAYEARAWSLIAFLAERRPAALAAYWRALRAGFVPDDAAPALTGGDDAAFEADWRAFVAAGANEPEA